MTAFELLISDLSSDVCSSDLLAVVHDDFARRLLITDAEVRIGVERDPRAVLQRRDLLLADRRRIARRLLRQPPSRNQGDEQEGRDERPNGRATCRERLCKYGEISVVAVAYKKNNTDNI